MSDIATKEIAEPALEIRQDEKNITIGALIQAGFTILSRVFGMVREVMISHIFGANSTTDAFFIAFTIPNVLRQFFGEGSFSVAFVPVYIETKEKGGEKSAQAFFRHAFGFLLLTLTLVTLFAMFNARGMVQLFAYGFSADEEQLKLAESLTRVMFPYVLMVSIVALFGAQLACYRRFAAMSAAPILLNIAGIFSMLWFKDYFNPPIMVLGAGVILGGILQLWLMIIALKRASLWQWPSFSINTDAMRHFMRLLGPSLFGIFVYQLNIIVLRQLASFLGEGQISYYYNADRLTQFAIGVFGVSIATAALPELSRGVSQYGREAFFDTLRFTMRITSFVITPCAVGLMIFAEPIISVIYLHGAFTSADALLTAQTLMAFAPSLIPFSLSRPLIQSFYAAKNTRTPVIIGAVIVALNLGLGLMLLRFQVVGLALTLSISSSVQFCLLLWAFARYNQMSFKSRLLWPFLSHVALSVLASLIGLFFYKAADWQQGFSLKNSLVLGIMAGACGITYLLFSYIFKLDEAKKLIDSLRARLNHIIR